MKKELKLSDNQKSLLSDLRVRTASKYDDKWYSWDKGSGYISTNTMKSLITKEIVTVNGSRVELTELGKSINL